MALKTIDLGTSPNKGDGDPLRTAFTKINDNFTEVYALLGADEVDTDDVIAPMLVHNNHTNVTVTRDDDADQIIFTVDQAVTDLQGSVFGDDSTLLVDGVNGVIPSANISGTEATNWDTAFGWGDHSTAGYADGTNEANWDTAFGWGDHSTAGYAPQATTYTKVEVDAAIAAQQHLPVGDLQGSVFADDSTLLVDGVNGKITGEVTGTISSTNWMAASDNYLTISNGGSTGPGPIQIVASANLDLSSGTNNDINITPHGSGRVKVSDGAFGIVEAATFIGHADKTMYLSSKTTGAESTHIALDSQSGVATTMYGAVDFVSGGSVDFTGSTVTGLPAAGATEINDLTDVDTATIAPSRSMQPLIWDDIDSNWYPGNGISLTTNLTMEDNSFIMLRKNAYINFEGSTTDGFDTRLEVVDPTANRTVRLPDADGTLALTADIPTALSDFTNDLDYAPIVGGAIQANGLPSGTTFTDTLTLPVLTAEPSSPVNGMVAVADGTSWDPMSNAAQTMVVYLAGAWRQIAQGGV